MTTPELQPWREQLKMVAEAAGKEGALDVPGLLPTLEFLTDLKPLPGAFRTRTKALVALLKKRVAPPDKKSVNARILQGLNQLLVDWPAVSSSALEPEGNSSSPAAPTSISDINRSEDAQSLLHVFLEAQPDRLQELEVLSLEREKGNASAKSALLGVLHNLKGEFGVLDLSSWSLLIHDVEDALSQDEISTDGLLNLVDMLRRQAEELAHGTKNEATAKDRSKIGLKPSPGMELEKDSSAGASSSSGLDAGVGREETSPWIEDPSFLSDFIAESQEHVRSIEGALLRLEMDPTAEDALHGAFRAFHTIKGLAAFLKLNKIRKLAHASENMLDQVRQHVLTLSPNHIDVLLTAADGLRLAICRLEAGEAECPVDAPDLVNSDIFRALSNPETIDENQPASSFPGVEEPLGQILVERGIATSETVEQALRQQVSGDERHLGEILVQDHNLPAKDVGHVLGKQTRARQESEATDVATQAVAKEVVATVEDSIRVPVEKLDLLIDAIGEAVISQSMVFADPLVMDARDLAVEKKMAQAALMMRRIQELSMSLRMVAIRQTFQKMSRLVRDLSRRQGKSILLELEGESTELDKTVVENIGDPLVHMVRNAVDHGIEKGEDRLRQGKPEQARLVLRAFHKGGSVHIEIEDDGKGLDRGRILEKAVSAGIVRPGQELADSEVWQLIFHPGLSTAEKVTDVSGRGVGMDVVKRNIENLRGTVDIRTVPGRGTCFTIRLPLTLAIIGGMTVRVGTERYIIPTLSVYGTLKPEPDQLSTVTGKGELLNLRGELIPLVRLHDQFDVPRERAIHEGVVLVVEDALGRRTGLVADEILDQQQVVVKSLGAEVRSQGLTGAAIMNDGTVSLILDVSGIVRNAHDQ